MAEKGRADYGSRTDTAGRRGDVRTTSMWAIVDGIVLIVLGLVAVFARYDTRARLIAAIALYLVVKGILEIVAAFRAEGEGGARLDIAFGMVSILAGVLVFLQPVFGGIEIATIIAGYFLVAGIARLALGWMARDEDTGWVWLLAMGAVELLLGIYVIAVATPLSALAVLVGIDIIATGAVMAIIGALERTRRIRAGVTPA